ncbi:hypothetical protein CEXT_637891 [Caerostris extrusa]|uniref:Uncharacterized protein n=1 Tax=Caerostris extrusa TaxID=172846 RepID=A0AAV4PCH9_CAEEX|nr:hypothetical protein CEXT_637891 [Caerostris extrusa]
MGNIEKRNLGGYRPKAVLSGSTGHASGDSLRVDSSFFLLTVLYGLPFAYDQGRYFIQTSFQFIDRVSFSCMGTIEKRNLGGYRQKPFFRSTAYASGVK